MQSQLHRQHKGAGWAGDGSESEFRKDLNEIAEIIGLRSLISLHINGDRELVRMVCGDYRQYYAEEVTFAKNFFRAGKPDNADVVISNAFPNDLSLTFVHMKGVYPLRHEHRQLESLGNRSLACGTMSSTTIYSSIMTLFGIPRLMTYNRSSIRFSNFSLQRGPLPE